MTITGRMVPTEPGLWMRKTPTTILRVVNVVENIMFYDGPRISLGFYTADGWKAVVDDGFWIREVRQDDVPLIEVERLHAEVADLRRQLVEARASASGAVVGVPHG